MSLKNLTNIKLSYYTLSDNVVEDLLLPCLNEAVEYKRAVAYFSSKVLLRMTHGLWNLAKKNGKMKLLVSPNLEVEDYEAMKKGYDLRDKITAQIIDDFDFAIDFNQKDARFSLLSYMIATNLLEIKIVLIADKPTRALFHRKTGIFIDDEGNMLSFAGSGNDTESGYEDNDELWEVSRSWFGTESEQRCWERNSSFDSIWNNADSKYITIPFPEVIKHKLLENYDTHKNYVDYTQIDEIYIREFGSLKVPKENTPFIPPSISLTHYQEEAIKNWVNNNYRGIFDMATGTGKTYAAAGAICKLYKDKERAIVIICCPTTILVEQWGDELLKFNIDAIKCYGATKNDYESRLKRSFSNFKHKINDFVCAVTTNATFQKDKIQDLMKEYAEDILLVVDEAHNFGGEKIIQTLNIDYAYRLALSATFERMWDEEGTDILYDFFGKKCIEYDTEKALMQGYLCHYYYHPICVSLSPKEYDEYVDLSLKYAKQYSKKGDTDTSETTNNDNNKYVKKKKSQIDPILLKRARLVAGAEDKIVKLKDVMSNYKDKSNILVYCGDPYVSIDGVETNNEEQVRQIDRVTSELYRDLGIISVEFTAAESSDTRKQIIERFKNGVIQAVVAIKCLDEGVDIPAIYTAFILASTTNPRQYIQRRGRLLRNSPGKKYAEIYDFVVLPRQKGTSSSYRHNRYWDIEKNLVRKEIERMEEFARLSDNPSEYYNLIDEINEEYELNNLDEEENSYGS